jgi:hypothetical protein
VGDLFELRQRRRANALGRRIGQRQLGVLLFQLLQFDEQLVVLGVGMVGASST